MTIEVPGVGEYEYLEVPCDPRRVEDRNAALDLLIALGEQRLEARGPAVQAEPARPELSEPPARTKSMIEQTKKHGKRTLVRL